ncbi:pyruvate ferredoxin oxidoreductase subunit gamma [Candidatus Bathyarchaeota archaeon]|nr:pyruvate ferredoxin oxidoreductase subunit gamma [Candidatus Bathyarchaeota archaeon]
MWKSLTEENCLVLKEVRWHGRGGQGAWTASELLARAAIHEGKFIQSFPEFGPERMGAPVRAFTRISDNPIRLHCSVYSPDVVVVLDPTLMASIPVAEGLKENGVIVVNTSEEPRKIKEELKLSHGTVWTVPATQIAIKILGRPITNTAMLGAVARATQIVSMESIEKAVKERFPAQLAEKNIGVIKEAYEEAKSE